MAQLDTVSQPTERRLRAVPVALATGPLLLAVAAAVTMVAAGGDLLGSYLVVDAVVGTVSAVLGGYLVARVPRNPMGWLFALSGSAYATTAAVTAWVTAAGVWGWPGRLAAAWVSEWAFVLALGPQATLLLLLFPDGAPPTPRWRWLGWLSGAVIGALAAAFMLGPEVHLGPDDVVPSPLAGSPTVAGAAGPLLVVLGLCALACFGSLLVRLRRAAADDRRRIAPYVVAATLATIALVATPPLAVIAPVVQTVVLPLLPVAATLCVLRYRLYDLEIAVRRSVVWLGLTVMVVGGYALVVEAVANLLQRQAGWPESVLAAGVVAAVFQPARLWLQRVASRALYGHRDDPDRALLELGRALEVTAAPTAALDRATERIRASLAVPYVSITVLRPDDDAEPAHTATAGTRPTWLDDDALTAVPLIHGGIPYGVLAVARRSPGEALSARDVDLLQRLAYPIAATAAAVRLTDELRRSREWLVLAREEERRRLRHDLHDELGPLLAGMAMQLDAATLRSRRTGGDETLLVDLLETTRAAIGTMRRAVDGLRPPALDELGLLDALEAAVSGFRAPGGPVLEVLAPDGLPPLPAAVEVAAYRIAIEAVTNAVRHGRPGSVRCRIGCCGDRLAVEVSDDGGGIPRDIVEGVGLGSMRERAEELGGSCCISALPAGGTLVRAELPIGRR